MINPDILAYIATSLNVVMLLPQVSKTLRTKETKDLSYASLLIFFIACILWLFYGITKQAAPIIISNVAVGSMNLILIILKVKYPGKE